MIPGAGSRAAGVFGRRPYATLAIAAIGLLACGARDPALPGELSNARSPALDGTRCADWTILAPETPPEPGIVPYGAQWPSAIYDAPRDRLIVFGGTGPSLDPPIDDLYPFTWALALSGEDAGTWTELATTGTRPWGRYNHTAIYDAPRDRMIVYGAEFFVSEEVWSLSLSGTL